MLKWGAASVAQRHPSGTSDSLVGSARAYEGTFPRTWTNPFHSAGGGSVGVRTAAKVVRRIPASVITNLSIKAWVVFQQDWLQTPRDRLLLDRVYISGSHTKGEGGGWGTV